MKILNKEGVAVDVLRVHNQEEGVNGYLTMEKEYVPLDLALILEIISEVKVIISLFSRRQIPAVLSINDVVYRLTFVYDTKNGKDIVTGGYQNGEGWLLKVESERQRQACKKLHGELKKRNFV